MEWIWDLYGRGKLVLGADERMYMDFDEREIECLMTVGLWCAHPDCNMRPSIRQAFQVLNFEAPLPNLPAKMPIPEYRVSTAKANASSSEPSISTSSLYVRR
ncbi:hypothetical protein Pint_27753 [Pistacia integerrima]|uniref:Uncharacterized protein n=1 Tax=Pistacia integerrima TaxID=434235 RepID=A0ACC0YS67_9ROSI|nr:hypothetical protein Pint_27753 [Pistacia integerrima]